MKNDSITLEEAVEKMTQPMDPQIIVKLKETGMSEKEIIEMFQPNFGCD